MTDAPQLEDDEAVPDVPSDPYPVQPDDPAPDPDEGEPNP